MQLHIFVDRRHQNTPCDRAKDFLTKQGLSFESLPGEAGKSVVVRIGDTEIDGWDDAKAKEAEADLKAKGYPATADHAGVNYFMVVLILFIMVIFVTMVYGPIAAFLVELFPTKIRYTSMSLPYHIGNGWFGGMLPLLATAMMASSGDIYRGLWYPIVVSLMTFVIGIIFLRDKNLRVFDIHE